MSFRNIAKAERAYKRIKIKEDYLDHFIPELQYLTFLENLEIFHAYFEGVYGGEELLLTNNDCVDSKIVKNKLTKLNLNYVETLETLKSLQKRLEIIEENTLFECYYKNLIDCKEYLHTSWTRFYDEIELYESIIYDIELILDIRNYLQNTSSKIYVLIRNLKNLEKSSIRKDIKDILKKIYESAISTLIVKFEEVLEIFPNQRITFSLCKIEMDEEQQQQQQQQSNNEEMHEIKPPINNDEDLNNKCSSETIDNTAMICETVESEGISDFLECLDRPPCPCDAPPIPEVFDVQGVCDVPSSSSAASTSGQQKILNENELMQKYQNEIEDRKDNLYKILNELLNKSRDITRIENEIFTKKSELDLRINCFHDKKTEIINNESLNETEKEEKIKCLEYKMFKMQKQSDEGISFMEDQKVQIRRSARCLFKELKQLMKAFEREHYKIVEELERLQTKIVHCNEMKAKMEILQINFDREICNMNLFKDRLTNLYEDGEYTVSSLTTSSDTETSSILTKSSLSKEAELLKPKDVKNDKGMYIKHVLGKALIQGLASITITQPTDPIYYLANYLLHYRYNELSTIRKQVNFEELLLEREKYAKEIEDPTKKTCDPCGMDKNLKCDGK